MYSLGKQTLQYYLDNNLYGYMIDTSLEGLAEQMGVPADTLAKTVEAFNAHTKAGVPTTLTPCSSLSKKVQLSMPAGVRIHT